MNESISSLLLFSMFLVFLLVTVDDLNVLHRHLEENLDDWLTEELDNYLDDDYLVFDCPGNSAISDFNDCEQTGNAAIDM